jgi:ubiquinone/menaquinone biosynthesis C-methylase UbiE
VGGHSWQRYDDVARAYERAWHLSFEPVARDLVDLVAPAPDDGVLDVGAGTGVVAAAAAERGRHRLLVGVDPSLPMLRRARVRAPLAPVAGRSPGLPFRPRTFDVVVANLVVSHFEHADASLADMVRVLRLDGRLGVTAWGTLDDEPVDDSAQRELTNIWKSVAAHFVDVDTAGDVVEAAIPGEAWFGDPAHLRAALEHSGLRRVELGSRTYRRTLSQTEALAGFETSFWGRYLRHALGDEEWERFRRDVAEAAATALPDPLTRVDQFLLAVGTKRFETHP